MTVNFTDTFTNLGIMIGNWFDLRQSGWTSDLTTQRQAAASNMKDSDDELAALTAFNDHGQKILAQHNTFKKALVSIIATKYLCGKLANDIALAGNVTADIVLQELSNLMSSGSQTIKENTITKTSPALTSSSIGNGTAAISGETQLNVTQQFKAVCVSAATAGEEVWQLSNEKDSSIVTRVTTGVATAVKATSNGASYFNLTITAGTTDFEVGDEFRWSMGSDEAGKFQTFFVEAFKRYLPSAASPTISDSLVL